MFLASLDVFGPIATVGIFIVQQTADAQLFGGRSIPTSPVTSARRLVTEYAIQPIAMIGGYRSICDEEHINCG